MGIGRNFFLWASRSTKMREALPKYRFVRSSVSRFMPGPELTDALAAAESLKTRGISTVVTHLGENVVERSESMKVTEHYLHALSQIQERGLDTHISVKLSELGLDFDRELCYANLRSLLEKALQLKNFVWVDMESSKYTEITITLYQRARAEFSNVGLCLQSYLFRTQEDLERLLPLDSAIRLVKGAYAESPVLAFASRKDNDENYFKLGRAMLPHIKEGKLMAAFATHDQTLLRRLQKEAADGDVPKTAYEIQMLYGIRAQDQLKLAREGFRVRVLISYGTYWFPWYMRRLAERPANVGFVLRNLFTG